MGKKVAPVKCLCGEDAEAIEHYIYTRYSVRCSKDYVGKDDFIKYSEGACWSGPIRETKIGAIKAWNKIREGK